MMNFVVFCALVVGTFAACTSDYNCGTCKKCVLVSSTEPLEKECVLIPRGENGMGCIDQCEICDGDGTCISNEGESCGGGNPCVFCKDKECVSKMIPNPDGCDGVCEQCEGTVCERLTDVQPFGCDGPCQSCKWGNCVGTCNPTSETAAPTADTASPTVETISPTAHTASPTAHTASPTVETASPTFMCLFAHTMISTPDGFRTAKEIVKGDFVLDDAGNPLKVLGNSKGGTATHFTRILKGALNGTQPVNEVLLTHGHIVKNVHGKEVEVWTLEKGNPKVQHVELQHPERVYNLITEQRSFVDVSGLHAVTWAEKEYDETYGTFYELQ